MAPTPGIRLGVYEVSAHFGDVKVREDGTVKVLDFGLAKAMDPPATAPNMWQSPTITRNAP